MTVPGAGGFGLVGFGDCGLSGADGLSVGVAALLGVDSPFGVGAPPGSAVAAVDPPHAVTYAVTQAHSAMAAMETDLETDRSMLTIYDDFVVLVEPIALSYRSRFRYRLLGSPAC